MIEHIEEADLVNQGRNKINANFDQLTDEYGSFIRSDGSKAMEAHLDMSGHQIKNVAPATSSAEAVNYDQAASFANKTVANNYAYVIPASGDPYSDFNLILSDQTGRAVRAKSIGDIFRNLSITNETRWTIKIFNHPTYYNDADFSMATSGFNLIGDGFTKLKLMPTTVELNEFILTRNLYFKDLSLIFNGTRMEFDKCTFDNCKLYCYHETAESKIQLKDVTIVNSDIISSSIQILEPGICFINNCRLSTDLTGTGVIDPNVINQIIPNLKTYIQNQINI